MRFAQLVAAAWLALCCSFIPAQAAKRVALVIGNGSYQHLKTLNNPPTDAQDLADALHKLDFDVDLGVDLTLTGMQQKASAFARRAQSADVALAFFAGHGVQAPDQRDAAAIMNYLLPIDADVNDAEDLRYVMTARDLMSGLKRAEGAQARILILDACRNSPIPQRLARGRTAGVVRGLAPEPKTDGMLIVYSTQPGEIAEDGAERKLAVHEVSARPHRTAGCRHPAGVHRRARRRREMDAPHADAGDLGFAHRALHVQEARGEGRRCSAAAAAAAAATATGADGDANNPKPVSGFREVAGPGRRSPE